MFHLDGINWLRTYRSRGTEYFSVYKNGQAANSKPLIARMGGDPNGKNYFRAGATPSGDLVIQLIPQSEHNPNSGDTWTLTDALTSFNVATSLGNGWQKARRYRFDVDPSQKALMVYRESAHSYK